MAEPRLPEPMTPERANKLSARWRVAAVVAALVGPVAFALEAPDWVLVACLLAVFWCVGADAEHRGWVKGYRAARPEADIFNLKRASIDRRCQGSGDPR